MVTINHAEVELRAAYKRLRNGNPQNESLKAKAKSGRRLVTISNVALEAGVSRTLIGHQGCRYDALRKEILAFAEHNPRSVVSHALMEALRAEIRFLKSQLELRDTYNAELLIELELYKKNDRGGRHTEDGVVTNFRSDRRRTRNPHGDQVR